MRGGPGRSPRPRRRASPHACARRGPRSRRSGGPKDRDRRRSGRPQPWPDGRCLVQRPHRPIGTMPRRAAPALVSVDMATTTRKARSDEELQNLVALLKEVDSVELKLTVPEPAQLSTAHALGLDPLQAQIRQVFFFDTPELALDELGLVVRARRSQKKGDDTVVKLRPVVPSELPSEFRRSPNFGVELDASPTASVCSGSLKGVPSKAKVRDAAGGSRPGRKL